jgi:hypothetical protein
LTGKIGCSGIQTDSKPNPSAVRAKAAGFAVYLVNGISNPIFITHLSGLDTDNPQISQICGKEANTPYESCIISWLTTTPDDQ